MFQMWTIRAQTTAKEVEVLDSPLWAINFCILKILSFWKKTLPFSFQGTSIEEK